MAATLPRYQRVPVENATAINGGALPGVRHVMSRPTPAVAAKKSGVVNSGSGAFLGVKDVT